MVINLADVEEPTREIIPPGIYDAMVDNVEFGNSRKGNPMLTWTFVVTDKEGKNHTLFYHNTLNDDRGKGRVKQTVNALISDEEEFDWTEFRPSETAEWAVGRQCRVRVRIQPANEEYDRSNSIVKVMQAAESTFLQS